MSYPATTPPAFVVHVGDVLDVLPTLGIFDASLSDPPYGLGFMARDWDHAVPGPAVWSAVLDRLRPGASLFAFGGTRTFHRLTCAVEDAGFEIRDVLMWLYGSGFPKNYDIGKGIDKRAGAEREVVGPDPQAARRNRTTAQFGGPSMNEFDPGYDGKLGRMALTAPATPDAQRFNGYGTALKPAYEPIAWGMKPRDGGFANNATEHGVAGINVDAGRVATGEVWTRNNTESIGSSGAGYHGGAACEIASHTEGRWPSNVILDEQAGAALDEQTGELTSGLMKAGTQREGVGYNGGLGFSVRNDTHGDSGGASRFYYCAKASRSEREAGLAAFEPKRTMDELPNEEDAAWASSKNPYLAGGASERRNVHPTVKPVDLCRYLAAMLLPPPREDGAPRRILVPFSGSGSEMIGCLLAGWDEVVGVELSEEYAEIARARLAHWERYRCAESTASKLEAMGQEVLL